MADEKTVDVDPLPEFPPTEHRLLDGPYDGEPGTAGVVYPAPGEVAEDEEVAPA